MSFTCGPAHSRGFTLIELLIVVAIIAILAAIAVPNFLEAQTRSKVSRCKSDIRSLATAVEAYRVDTNHYLPHNDTEADVYPLTTPVAFLSAVPHDPFKDPHKTYSDTGQYYVWQDLQDIYFNKNAPGWGGGTWLRDQVSAGRAWSWSSYGPDQVETMCNDCTAVYDPTNGTASAGDVLMVP